MTDDLANLGAALAIRSGAKHGLAILQPHLSRADRVFQASSLAAVSRRDNPVAQIPGAPVTAVTAHREQTDRIRPEVQEAIVKRRLAATPFGDRGSPALPSAAMSPGTPSSARTPSRALPGTVSLHSHTPSAPREAATAAGRPPQAHNSQLLPGRMPQDEPRTPDAPVQEHVDLAYPAQLGANGQAAGQTAIAETPTMSVAPVDLASRWQTGPAGNADPLLYSAQGPAGQITSHASSPWQPPIPYDSAEPGASNSSSQTGEADSQSEGRLILDNGLLGRWVIDHISHAADRPATGSTGFDPRISRTWPGALQSL